MVVISFAIAETMCVVCVDSPLIIISSHLNVIVSEFSNLVLVETMSLCLFVDS